MENKNENAIEEHSSSVHQAQAKKKENWYKGMQIAGLFLDIGIITSHRMKKLKMRPSELAKKIGKSKKFVIDVMHGEIENLTIETLAKISFALDFQLTVDPENHECLITVEGRYNSINPWWLEKR